MAEYFAQLVIFTGSFMLLVYWLARLWLIFRHPEEVLNQVLDSDLSLGRRVWLFVRLMFAPPQTYSL
jgi:hypothetical protein